MRETISNLIEHKLLFRLLWEEAWLRFFRRHKIFSLSLKQTMLQRIHRTDESYHLRWKTPEDSSDLLSFDPYSRFQILVGESYSSIKQVFSCSLPISRTSKEKWYLFLNLFHFISSPKQTSFLYKWIPDLIPNLGTVLQK